MEYFIMLDDPSAVWLSQSLLDDKIDSNLMHAKFINDLDKNYIKLEKKINVISNGEILKELTDFTANGSFESLNKNVEYTDENGVPFIRIKNMSKNGLVMEDVKFVTENTYEYLKKSKLEGNEVLFSKTGANLGLAMVFPENFGKASLADNTFKVTYKEGYDKHYLVSFFNCKYGKLWVERLSQGSAQPTIIKESFRQIKIPIPSIEIQKYIGDKVRKAEELREEAKILKREAEDILSNELDIKKLNERLNVHTEKYSWRKSKSLSDRIDGEFYKTKFVLNNEHIKSLKLQGIDTQKLKDIIFNGSYGILPSSSDYGKGEVELLRSTNIKEFLIDDSDVIKVPEDYYKDKIKISNGDILLEIKGNCYTGAIVENIKKKTIINGSIFKFLVKEEFNSYYVLGYLLSQSGQLQKKQNLANSIISYLSIDCINDLIIPVISKEKQNSIGDKYRMYVQNCIKSKQLIKEAKQDIEDLIEGNFDTSKIKEINQD